MMNYSDSICSGTPADETMHAVGDDLIVGWDNPGKARRNQPRSIISFRKVGLLLLVVSVISLSFATVAVIRERKNSFEATVRMLSSNNIRALLQSCSTS
jgi:hypothetical protein